MTTTPDPENIPEHIPEHGPENPPGTHSESHGAPTPEGTVLLVRRSRTPALGFWVLLSLAATALIGAIAGLLLGVGDLAGIGYFAVVSAVVIGLPLAGIAAFVDARRSSRRR